MIQRIQSVYLLLVVAALVVCIFLPVSRFAIDNVYYDVMNYGMVDSTGEIVNTSVWGLIALLVVAIIIALGTIFLYKNRVLQMRLIVFNSLILIGYYATLIAYAVKYLKDESATGCSIAWACGLPLVAIILNYLAWRAIGKDEFMVRAADRLR